MKTKKVLETLGLICAYAICIYAIFIFVDYISDGFIVEWLADRYTYSWKETDDFGSTIIFSGFLWGKIESDIFMLVVVNCFIWISLYKFMSYQKEKKQRQEITEDISQMIQEYMVEDRRVTDVFPNEYSSVATQMIAIKTKNQETKQALENEASRKNDLITYLAHDLKTPLTSVIGYLSLLDEASDMPLAQKNKYIHISFEKALRLEKLINEFFDITRFNLHQIQLDLEKIDLSYMLMQMADEFYPILNEHGNTIEMRIQENLWIEADAIKLARVFNNILKNAINYSYVNTPILITASQNQTKTTISLQNMGKTIPSHRLESIFEKFFRLDDARQTNNGGAGLGLAIAKEIVTLHHGTIHATSKDGRTTFTVTIPNEYSMSSQ